MKKEQDLSKTSNTAESPKNAAAAPTKIKPQTDQSTPVAAKKKPRKKSISNVTWCIDGVELSKPQVKQWICKTIEHSSLSLRALLLQNIGSPDRRLVYEWLKFDPEFNLDYARVRVSMADYLAEEIIEIADDATNDYMQALDNKGEGDLGYKFMGEHTQRSKLRVDARKWIMSKMMPNKYGDKQTIVHEESPLSDKTMAELEDMARDLLSQRVISEQ